MSASSWVHLEGCEVKAITTDAILIESEDYSGWLPKSMVSENDQYEVGDLDVTISLAEWFAIKKGIV